MTTTTNAALAAQVSALLTRWNASQDQLEAWLAGAPDGGPNLDGRFPLTNSSGETILVPSLPTIESRVSGPAGDAEAAKVAAELAAAQSDNHRLNAEVAKGAAEVAQTAAKKSRDEALVFRNEAAASHANAEALKRSIEYTLASTEQAAITIDGGSAASPASPNPFTIDFGGAT